MFTGLVQENATLLEFDGNPQTGWRLVVQSALPELFALGVGASIAINGACMTLVEKSEPSPQSYHLRFHVSKESVDRSNFVDLKPGQNVHLEAAMKLSDSLGGHLVSGHIDAVGCIKTLNDQGNAWDFVVEVSGQARQLVAPYLVEKGSIAVDGVSLTVNRVVDTAQSTEIHIALIPHTILMTRFKKLGPGARVNLEADLVAKYVDRAHTFRQNYGV